MNIYNIAFSFPPVLLFAFYYIVLLIKIQCGNRLRFHEEKAERLFPSLLLIIYICFPTDFHGYRFFLLFSCCYEILPFSISYTTSATFIVDTLWDTRTTVFSQLILSMILR